MGILKGLFSKKQESTPIPQATPQKPKGVIKTQRHKLDNVEEHMKEIMELVEKNEDYKLSKKDLIEDGREDEKIYEYELSEKATLIFGEGAESIQVFVHDVHIGDIKKGSKAKVKKLLESGTIQSIETEVSGGNYKKVRYDSSRDKYFFDELEDVFGITIEITYREEIES